MNTATKNRPPVAGCLSIACRRVGQPSIMTTKSMFCRGHSWMRRCAKMEKGQYAYSWGHSECARVCMENCDFTGNEWRNGWKPKFHIWTRFGIATRVHNWGNQGCLLMKYTHRTPILFHRVAIAWRRPLHGMNCISIAILSFRWVLANQMAADDDADDSRCPASQWPPAIDACGIKINGMYNLIRMNYGNDLLGF